MPRNIQLLIALFATVLLSVGFVKSIHAQQALTLSWDQNTEEDLHFYKVHYKRPTDSNYTTYQEPVFNNYLDLGPEGSNPYLFVVTAVDYSNNESTYSKPITVNLIAPKFLNITLSTIVIEAEEMDYHDNGAQSGDYWGLWGNGAMSENVYFPAQDLYHIEIVAKGSLVSATGPEMELIIDGVTVGTVSVDSETPELYAFDVEVTAGDHTVAVGFYNDVYDPSGEDRNLYVDKIIISSESQISTSTETPRTSFNSDRSPPTGTIIINQGNDIAPSQFVTLLLSATDDRNGMGQGALMCLSNDNEVWTTPQPFTATKDWKLSSGNGTKTVYVKFCDAGGIWMEEPVSDSIELQLNCPKPLQLDATAIASSGAPLIVCSEDKVVDGRTGTGWLSPLRRSLQDEYLILDLGDFKVINRIDICSNLFLLLNLFPRDFKVQGSFDNQQWVDLFTVTDYSPPLSRTDSWSFDDTEIRYIRLIATKARRFLFFFYATYIAEIKAYGCAKPEVDEPQVLSPENLSQTEPGVEEPPDTQEKEKRKLQPRAATPGRPGRPVFILNGKP